jgi:hypothetical protein
MLDEELKTLRKTENIGPITGKIIRRPEYVEEIKKLTSYLDGVYEEVSLSQRLYHLLFEDNSIEKCECGSPKKFNKNNRLSPEGNKVSANYHPYCESIECLVKNFRETTKGKQAYGSLIYKIQKDVNFIKSIGEKTSFLDSHYEEIRISQRLYHVFFNFYEIEKCPYCSDPRKYSTTKGFSEDRNRSGHNYWQTCEKKECLGRCNSERMKESIMEKYGVSNSWDIPGYRESIEKTNLEKYGAKYFTGTKDFQKKCQEKYDKDWGGKHPTSHDSVKEKKEETNLEKYGYKCALNNPEISEKQIKSSYQTVKYKMPRGKIVNVQGYEKYAIEEILRKEMSDENDIIMGRSEIHKCLGDFIYIVGEKERFYFPDIYLKNLNKIIEVKSKYTYESGIEINNLKKESVIKKGIEFEFWIFSDSTKDLIIIR